MQVINILSDYLYIKIFFQLSQSKMALIRFTRLKLSSPFIIESQYQFLILCPGPGRCNLIYIIFFPETARIPEGFYSALRAHSGACLLYTSPSPRDRTRSRM